MIFFRPAILLFLLLSSFNLKAQVTLFDTTVELFMKNRFLNIVKLISDTLNHEPLYLGANVKEIQFDEKKNVYSGQYLLNEQEQIPFQSSLADFNIFIKTSGDFLDDDWNNIIYFKVGLQMKVKGSNEKMYIAELPVKRLQNIFTIDDLNLIRWVVNHKNLFTKKMIVLSTVIDQNSFTEYATFTTFTINIRLRNFIMNNHIQLYEKPIFYYENEKLGSLIFNHWIDSLWSDAKANAENFGQIDTTGRSALHITADSDQKYFCLSPVLSINKSTLTQQMSATHYGYVIYEKFRGELDDAEKYMIWHSYRSLIK